MNAKPAPIPFQLMVTPDKQRVADLLCSALEGGSNYWYQIEKFITPPTPVAHTGLDGIYRHVDYPLCDGGAIVVSDRRGASPDDVKTTTVDWPRLQEGLRLMAERYPRHFGDWLAERDDADTGDVFLQLCVLGEVVYG
jgi:hypothetical protein